MFPIPAYAFACIINVIIRFAWAANRIPSLAAIHASHLMLMVELAEVARRAMWNLFRIEWEIIVQAERASSRDNLVSLLPQKGSGSGS